VVLVDVLVIDWIPPPEEARQSAAGVVVGSPSRWPLFFGAALRELL